MTFLRLGYINARRSMARSLFAIISMAIAAGFLTYSISLSRGYPLLYKADPRAVVGGEAIVYARQFGGRIPEGDSQWQHSFFEESPFSDLATFHPELLKYGYLSVSEDQVFFNEADLERIAAAHPAIKELYPRYQLPATTVRDVGRVSVSLHGRDAVLDQKLRKHPAELVAFGRWFAEADAGQPVAIASTVLPPEWELSKRFLVGDVIQVAIPRFTYIDGRLVMLEGDPLFKELTIIGLIEATTRYETVGGAMVPIYWGMNELQLPLQTWKQFWQEAGGMEYFPEQVSLLLEEQAYLEDIIYDLSNALPEFTVYSTASHFHQAENRGLIERLSGARAALTVAQESQAAMPLDLRFPFSVLIFVNAALIVAANLLIMVSERTREIGILKAVGSTRFQVVQMVVAEAFLISIAGATFGFLFFRIPATLNQLTNQLSTATIGAGFLSDATVVYGVTLVFSAVFGLLPGFRMATLSVMEVLRSE